MTTCVYLGASGIVLNGDTASSDGFGCDWGLTSGSMWGSASPRAQVSERANDHGEVDQTRFKQARIWSLEGDVNAPNHAALHDAEQRFRLAVDSGAFTTRGVEPGRDRWATCRVDGDLLWAEVSDTYATFSVALKAPDPRLYATATTSFSAPLPPAGSPKFPFDLPIEFSVAESRRDVTNTGTTTSWPKYRLTGPMTNPVIENDEGDQLRFRLTLAANEWLTVDTHPSSRRVLLLGDESLSRKGAVDGTWWGLEPGGNTVIFKADNFATLSPDQFFGEVPVGTWF